MCLENGLRAVARRQATQHFSSPNNSQTALANAYRAVPTVAVPCPVEPTGEAHHLGASIPDRAAPMAALADPAKQKAICLCYIVRPKSLSSRGTFLRSTMCLSSHPTLSKKEYKSISRHRNSKNLIPLATKAACCRHSHCRSRCLTTVVRYSRPRPPNPTFLVAPLWPWPGPRH